jgi:hypothetical protein
MATDLWSPSEYVSDSEKNLTSYSKYLTIIVLDIYVHALIHNSHNKTNKRTNIKIIFLHRIY